VWLAPVLIVALPLLIVVTFLWAVYRRGGAEDMGAAARALQIAWPRRDNNDGRGQLGRGRDRQPSGDNSKRQEEQSGEGGQSSDSDRIGQEEP
jgi:hypothetical protein